MREQQAAEIKEENEKEKARQDQDNAKMEKMK